jgi:hypothetical protein
MERTDPPLPGSLERTGYRAPEPWPGLPPCKNTNELPRPSTPTKKAWALPSINDLEAAVSVSPAAPAKPVAHTVRAKDGRQARRASIGSIQDAVAQGRPPTRLAKASHSQAEIDKVFNLGQTSSTPKVLLTRPRAVRPHP